jgi:hypothetical protein
MFFPFICIDGNVFICSINFLKVTLLLEHRVRSRTGRPSVGPRLPSPRPTSAAACLRPWAGRIRPRLLSKTQKDIKV